MTPALGTAELRPGRDDGRARAFVTAVWCLMAASCLVALVRDTRNVPLAEDWLMVPAMTGNEPHLLAWLWAQNSEHRIPLPRALLLLLLKATGDFRAGAALSVAIVAGLALAFVAQARSFRGRAAFADAFFPVALLGLGHWENLFWSWQLTFVVSSALVSLLVLAVAGPLLTRSRAIVAGLCLVLLPLCGATGLVFAPALAPWLAWRGARLWVEPGGETSRRAAGRVLVVGACAAVVLTGLYFIGYERASWPPNPGLGPSLLAALQFQALGFGPITRTLWDPPLLATAVFLLATGAVATRAALRAEGVRRQRAVGLLLSLASAIVLALAVGWGRAGVIALYRQWPIRYALIALPGLFAGMLVWQEYATGRIGRVVPAVLLLTAALLLPLNTVHGLLWRDWYVEGMAALQRDVRSGVALPELARRHRGFLVHFMDAGELASSMRMLHDRGVGLFAAVRDAPSGAAALAEPGDPHAGESREAERTVETEPRHGAAVDAAAVVSMEIRYRRPEAGTVLLGWGVNGWQPVAEDLRPPGTHLGRVLYTPMARRGGTFVTTLRVPSSAIIDYGYLVTRTRAGAPVYFWETNDHEPYHVKAVEHGVAEDHGPPLLREEFGYMGRTLEALAARRGFSGALLLVSMVVGIAAAAAGAHELVRCARER